MKNNNFFKRIAINLFILLTVLFVSCSDTTSKVENCKKNSCNEGQVCNESTGKCEDLKRCTETGCEEGFVCNEISGLCEKKQTCLDTGCSETQFVIMQAESVKIIVLKENAQIMKLVMN